MPERVTKEERLVSLAIEKARKTKEMLSQRNRENVESTQVIPNEMKIEIEKVKRPKAQNVKVENQTQKKEGYGLAGEISKAKFQGPTEEFSEYKLLGKMMVIISAIKDIVDRPTIDKTSHDRLKEIVRRANSHIDEYEKYKSSSKFRIDEKDLRVKD